MSQSENERSIKIALYMTTVLEYGGGLEKYMIDTAAYLATQPGVTVNVVTLDDNFTKRIIRALSVFYMKRIDIRLSFKLQPEDIKARLGSARYIKTPNLKALRAELQKYDVIYSKNELLEAGLLKIFVKYNRLPPIIFGGHTALRYPTTETWQSSLHNMLYTGPVYRFLAGGVTAFHALNDSELAVYKKLFPRRRVYKIYNPFDLEAYRNAANQKAFLALKKGHSNILWAGRLTEQKGVSLLASLIEQAPGPVEKPFYWHIIGDGENRHQLDAVSASRPNVKMYGHVDPSQMPTAYNDADVFLCTSKWEGYPYVLLEARAFGLPIVATKIPGATDILNGYQPGQLVEDAAQTEAALVASASYKRVAPKAEDEVSFEPAAIYGQLLGMFEAVA